MIIDILISGIPLGCLYSLIAVGYNVAYRPTNVFNFAQGDLVMLGAMLSAAFMGAAALPWPIALALAVIVVAMLGAVIERVAVWPVLRGNANSHAWVITTLAVSLIITNVVGKIWGMDPVLVAAPWPLSTDPIQIGSVRFSTYQIALVIISFAVVAIVELSYRTMGGLAMLAVAENRDAALLRGINPSQLSFWSFVASGGLAALAGYLASPLVAASTSLGAMLLVRGFAAAALGGLGNNKGALVAGLIIGVAEAAGAELVSAGYQQGIILAVLLVILLVKPQGLFGSSRQRTV
jgi:branched-chain amino acid transport system permease protein